MVELKDIKHGTIIAGPKWHEPVEVKKIDNDGSYVHIIGATTITAQHVDQIIPIDELSDVKIKVIETDFRSEPSKVFLALEVRRYRFASLYDPLLAMNTSKVDPLPHQIEAVYGYILKLPRIRFLIADDPGAGKTIMAGLIIKELKLRSLAKRVLIVVPGHLKDQWRRELKEKFEETFVVIDRGLMDAHYAENVWERENQIITSIDFAKRDEISPSLSAVTFDLIIIDEAHKMSAYRYGDKLTKTNRYRLGEILSKSSDPHMLLLTATPHKGDPENFRLFMDLLEPGFFATAEMLQESIRNKDNPLFIRRMKEDLKDFEGKPLFLNRYVKTAGFYLSDEEKILYNDVSRYVKEQYNKALSSEKRRNVAFALVILQRRLASSTYAILRSLERRKKRLEDMIESALKAGTNEKVFDFEEVEDLSEEDRWKEEALWETLSVAENRQELQIEIRTLDELIEKAKAIIRKEIEVKILELKKTLADLTKKFPHEKMLIFTESKDTLEYLEKKIRSWGYSINTIHGGMRLEDRVEAESIFKNQTQVLAATEAAGEGINLQFCHLMINYDIPWNPNRLEQRMGRIHRYGQTKEVFVFNMVAENTREGRVLARLFEKLEEIRNALQTDRVFDVISEVLYGKNLSQLMIEAAASARNIDEILREIDVKVDEQYISRIKDNLGESLATKYIDYTRLKEMAQKARENRLIPEYTEAFFKKAFDKAGGRLRERRDEFVAVESVPFVIKSIASEDRFKKRFGPLLRSYSKMTFDKDIAFRNPDAEFVTFGHPLFESMLEWVDRELSPELQKGAVFVDPEGNLDGYILFYEGEVRDGTGSIAGKSLFAYYYDSRTVEVKTVSPTIMWDLTEGEVKHEQPVDLESLKGKVLPRIISGLNDYMRRLQEDRNRQARIKEKYGLKSLDKLVVDLDGQLIELETRRERRENVDLAIRNKEDQKRKYERSRDELEELIGKEKNLTMSMPVFVGIVRARPSLQVMEAMQRDEEIERIGMHIAIQYERDGGRIPEDVSKENSGFDIRSKDKDGTIRYIEVKARAAVGAVALTQNEWFKAERLANDYYLYVVWNAGKDPKAEPIVIQNPVQNLNFDEKVEVVRYVIAASEIEQKRG
jgi:superfamily II DNA or RNA helicase